MRVYKARGETVPANKPLHKDVSDEEVKWRERRRGSRVNSSVPIGLAWEDRTGKRQQLEAKTRLVGPYGCLVVLPEELELEQHVHVTNMANQQAAAAAVVWKGKRRTEGWEFGIELVSPDLDFWGLDV